MSAEEYASKELHEWREATIKKDIEVRLLSGFRI
jgi:hypothetical protein